MANKCNYCINKSQCSECNIQDKFIPSEEVRWCFEHYYVGVRGIDGCVWEWNSSRKGIEPTSEVQIEGSHYCPYCGETMFSIQGCLAKGIKNYDVTGYCCLCQGARNELAYKHKVKALKQKHEDELYAVQTEYREKLVYCTDKLFEIKQREEKKRFDFFKDHHSYFNVVTPNDIFE